MVNYEAAKCRGWGEQSQNAGRSKAQTQSPARSGTLCFSLNSLPGMADSLPLAQTHELHALSAVSLRAGLGRYRKLSAVIPAPENYSITSQLRDTISDLILILWLTAYHNEARIETKQI